MSIKNYYPQFEEIPYKRTKVDMPVVVLFARSLVGQYAKEVVRIAYVIFRNESFNGLLGVNNNYAGIQADNGEWSGLDLSHVNGTCVKTDNAGDSRRFICFDDQGFEVGFNFLCSKIEHRNMYALQETLPGIDDAEFRKIAIGLYHQYESKWVANSKEDTGEELVNFISLYRSSIKAIF